jgi:hypothetical protein
MTCDDEAQKVEAKWEAIEDVTAELAVARKKLKSKLAVSLVMCGGGAAATLVGGGLVAIIGGGAACIAALLDADDAATDYGHAVAKSKLTHQRHAQALMEELMCLSHCSPQDPP